MTRKQQRVRLLIGAGIILSVAAVLVFSAMRDSLVFFHTPSDILEKKVEIGKTIRVGGLVEEGTVGKLDDGVTFTFSVTDSVESVTIQYKGLLPDLFREGQGVVVEGSLDQSGVVVADEVLAKHDENYMPKEVADSLKEKGYWKHAEEEGQTQY